MSETNLLPGREEQALALVKRHVPWAVGAGVLPIPGVDFAALLGDVLGATLSGGMVSLARMVPILGTVVSVVALPAMAGAVTYAVGRVFISHFEAGGTFLDLDPKKMRGYFRK